MSDFRAINDLIGLIEKQGRNLSSCTWGLFDGHLVDLRDEE